MPVQFSLDDIKTVESLERVLRQFQRALNVPAGRPALTPTDLSSLIPFIRDQLQATGTAPLNVQSLPGIPSSVNNVTNNITNNITNLSGRWEPLTNGNASAPELVFDPFGDVIMVFVP